MLGTQRGTRFAKVMFPCWKGFVTGGGDGRPGLSITGYGYAHALDPSRGGHDLDRRSRNGGCAVLQVSERLHRVGLDSIAILRYEHLTPEGRRHLQPRHGPLANPQQSPANHRLHRARRHRDEHQPTAGRGNRAGPVSRHLGRGQRR